MDTIKYKILLDSTAVECQERRNFGDFYSCQEGQPSAICQPCMESQKLSSLGESKINYPWVSGLCFVFPGLGRDCNLTTLISTLDPGATGSVFLHTPNPYYPIALPLAQGIHDNSWPLNEMSSQDKSDED